MVSRKTVSRMSRYRRLLQSLRESGVESIYSHQLARHAVVSAAQVRRDLMVIGYSGSPNKGYDVAACIESIGNFLDGPVQQEVALVGVGNLGHAVLSHFADKSPSVAIVAAFDVDPALTDTLIHGVRCVDVARMESLVRDLGIQIAVLTVPGEAAQDAADTLVRAGVKSIISFAPTPARPAQRHLRRVHGHHGGARVGRLLRAPRRPRGGADERRRRHRADGQETGIPAREVEHEARRSGRQHRGARRDAGQARRHRRSRRSTPATG